MNGWICARSWAGHPEKRRADRSGRAQGWVELRRDSGLSSVRLVVRGRAARCCRRVKTYEHNRDRAPSAGCTERPNFAFDVPSNWQVKESTCDFVALVAANEPAELQAVVLELPDYPQDVEAALDEMASRWLQEVTTNGGSVERVQRDGLGAISRTHVEPASQHDACESYVDVLGVPSKSWDTHGQWAVVLAVARCTDAHDQATVTAAIMDSFRLVEPY